MYLYLFGSETDLECLIFLSFEFRAYNHRTLHMIDIKTNNKKKLKKTKVARKFSRSRSQDAEGAREEHVKRNERTTSEVNSGVRRPGEVDRASSSGALGSSSNPRTVYAHV